MPFKSTTNRFNRIGTMKTIKEELFKWVCEKQAMNCFLDRDMLRKKALELTRIRGLYGFKCSKAWLTNFLKEYGFSSDLSRHTGPIFTDYRNWIDLMRSTITSYKHENLFHADQLTMYSNILPSGITSNGSENLIAGVGTKSTRNPITILMGCNSSGTMKLPLLICGPYSPEMTVKEHYYCHSEDCYIGDELFRNWLSNVNNRMIKCNRQILLFLPRNRAHALKDFVASNVQLVYLPEDFPSRLRPLRRDVFHYVKMIFRRRFAERLKQCIAEWKLRDILVSLIEAWETLPRELIIFSFQRTHFRTDNCFLQIHCDTWDSLKTGVSFKRFVMFDDDLSNERAPYKKNDRCHNYKFRTNCENVIQINDNTLDFVLEDTKNVGETTVQQLSNDSGRDRRTVSLELRNDRNRKLDHVMITSHKKSHNDSYRNPRCSRLKENPIERSSEQRKSRKRIYSETKFFTKRASGNQRASRSRNINNISLPKDTNVASLRLNRRKAVKHDRPQRYQQKVNEIREFLQAIVDKALTLLSTTKANYPKNLMDSIYATSQETIRNANNVTQLKCLSEQDAAKSKCANQRTRSSEYTNNIAANSPLNFFGKFNQPSTSTNTENTVSEEIEQDAFKDTIESQPFKITFPSAFGLHEENHEKSQNSNLIVNSNDEDSLSAVCLKNVNFSKKKRQKSPSSNVSGDDSQSSEPSEKKPKTNYNWTEQFETTFVFGSTNTNCFMGEVQRDESITNSCIFNITPSVSPKD